MAGACNAFGEPMTQPAVPVPPSGQLFELKIVATGEVRDADGNLIETRPVEATAVVTEAQARALLTDTQPLEEQ